MVATASDDDRREMEAIRLARMELLLRVAATSLDVVAIVAGSQGDLAHIHGEIDNLDLVEVKSLVAAIKGLSAAAETLRKKKYSTEEKT
jgi:hypothetical protein